MKGEVGNMQTLIDALKHIKTLDGSKNEVDVINMSVGQFNLPEGLDEIINELASNKVLISSAGTVASLPTSQKEHSTLLVLCIPASSV